MADEVEQADRLAPDPQRNADETVEARRRDHLVLATDDPLVDRQVLRNERPVLTQHVREPDVLERHDVTLPRQHGRGRNREPLERPPVVGEHVDTHPVVVEQPLRFGGKGCNHGVGVGRRLRTQDRGRRRPVEVRVLERLEATGDDGSELV